jgi:hypothetical protein
MVHATDTDVVVIAMALSIQLTSCELWIAFGHGDKFRFIAVHAIAASLGPEMSQGILFMHAISGCDSVSSMCGIGKKTAWHVWKSLLEVNQVFNRLSHTPDNISVSDVEQLERYVVLLYNHTSDESLVNAARKHLFCHENRKYSSI